MIAYHKILSMSFAATLFTLAGCAHGSPANTNNEIPVASGDDTIISMWSGPVKDRGTRFDVSFNIKNMSAAQSISIPSSELSCRRGSARGELKAPSKAKLESGVYLKPGLTRTLSLSCLLAEKSRGDYTIEVGKIFQANLNGTPSAKVLAKNLSWHYVDAESPN